MHTETKSELVRIGSNLARIFLSLASGVFIAHYLLRVGGVSAFSVYTFVTIGLGFSAMFREIVRMGVIPKMSKYIDNPEAFNRFLNSVFIACIGIALIAAASLALVAGLMDDTIALASEHGSRQYVLARACFVFLVVAFSPFYCVALVLQKFVLTNTLMFLEKFADVLAISFLVTASFMLLDLEVLFLLGLFSLAFSTLFYIYFLKTLFSTETFTFSLIPANFTKKAALESAIILRFLKTPIFVVIALNIFLKLDMLLLAFWYPAFIVAAFGLSIQLTGLVRQVCNGMANGLDAVVSRQGGGVDKAVSQINIISKNVSMQCFIVGHAAVFIFLFSEKLFELWLPSSIEPEVIQTAHWMSVFLIIGLGARGIAESWMAYLNGKALISEYSKMLMLVGIVNAIAVLLLKPFISPNGLLIVMMSLFAVLHFYAYLIYLPKVFAKVSRTNVRHLYIKLLRSALIPFTGIVLIRSISTNNYDFYLFSFFFLIDFVLTYKQLTRKRPVN